MPDGPERLNLLLQFVPSQWHYGKNAQDRMRERHIETADVEEAMSNAGPPVPIAGRKLNEYHGRARGGALRLRVTVQEGVDDQHPFIVSVNPE